METNYLYMLLLCYQFVFKHTHVYPYDFVKRKF